MKVRVMAVGRPREPFILEGLALYGTRLRPLLPTEWEFLPEAGRGRRLKEERRRDIEGADVLRRLESRDELLLLDERGRQWSSVEFSSRLYERAARAPGKVVFLVGGPYGVSDAVRERADETLSLSRLTFTHEMALLILAEQIYRAAMIRAGSKYHH